MRYLIFTLACVGSVPLRAQDTSVARLPAMVTVTRQPAKSPLDLPFGISTASPDSLRPGQAHVSADQTLRADSRAHRFQSHESVAGRPRLGARLRRPLGVRRPQRAGDPRRDAADAARWTDAARLPRSRVGRTVSKSFAARPRRSTATRRAASSTFIRSSRSLRSSRRRGCGSAPTRCVARLRLRAEFQGEWSFQGNVGQTESDNYREYSTPASHQRLRPDRDDNRRQRTSASSGSACTCRSPRIRAR